MNADNQTKQSGNETELDGSEMKEDGSLFSVYVNDFSVLSLEDSSVI